MTPTGDQGEKITEKESRLYDIVHEEIENKKEVITLNGAAMIREKLNISQKGTFFKFLAFQKVSYLKVLKFPNLQTKPVKHFMVLFIFLF